MDLIKSKIHRIKYIEFNGDAPLKEEKEGVEVGLNSSYSIPSDKGSDDTIMAIYGIDLTLRDSEDEVGELQGNKFFQLIYEFKYTLNEPCSEEKRKDILKLDWNSNYDLVIDKANDILSESVLKLIIPKSNSFD